ncbi:MAG: Uma2 family endonuclease [Deltaproteobacteria bacterium]|nr:Uma2 family endonuclease [Deltaproteobacteria bacterium]
MPERPRPLRRVEYEKMVELGLFDDERLELIEGVIVTMSPQGSRHAAAVRKLNHRLTLALSGRAFVQVQSPIALDEHSEPEPDVAVVPMGDYDRELPKTALLIVEVADSSLQKDRQVKSRLYAGAAIPEYWIVDLEQDVVEVWRAPRAGIFTVREERRRGDLIALDRFPDVSIAVDEILPR